MHVAAMFVCRLSCSWLPFTCCILTRVQNTDLMAHVTYVDFLTLWKMISKSLGEIKLNHSSVNHHEYQRKKKKRRNYCFQVDDHRCCSRSMKQLLWSLRLYHMGFSRRWNLVWLSLNEHFWALQVLKKCYLQLIKVMWYH